MAATPLPSKRIVAVVEGTPTVIVLAHMAGIGTRVGIAVARTSAAEVRHLRLAAGASAMVVKEAHSTMATTRATRRRLVNVAMIQERQICKTIVARGRFPQ